jgi:ADP-heptose:LPS heptosyltransferase
MKTNANPNANATMESRDKSLRRILLVRNDRIGDLVLTLPAFEAVRRHWPGAHLTALVSSAAGPLLAGHRALDELLFDAESETAWQLGRKLRAMQFDAAIVFNTNTRNCLAVWAARLGRRVCWAYKPAGWLAATHRVALRRSHPPVHEAEFALAFARRLGAPADLAELAPHLEIDPAARGRIAERIGRELGTVGPLFGVHPGSRNSAYNWPASRYAELVCRLAPFGRVMVTGTARERPILEVIRRRLSDPAAGRVEFFIDLELQELAAALAEQTALVVSSTGPMHVAAAVGTPVVALFSPHPAHAPAKWAPLGKNHTLLVAPLEGGEDARVPPERGTDLMSRIRVDQVLRAALDYIPESAAGAA